MPTQTKVLLEKRMQIFFEHCKFKRQKSRMDVYMESLKLISNNYKEIYELEDKDVLRFLIYKDVNDSGRTIVQKENCPHIGTSSADSCLDKIQCGLRHQAESMQVGIVDKLRRGFEEVGRKGLLVLWTKWETLHVLS